MHNVQSLLVIGTGDVHFQIAGMVDIKDKQEFHLNGFALPVLI